MSSDALPIAVGWELTLACNLRCRHCGSAAGLPRPCELTLEEGLGVCGQLAELLVAEVDFTGGEPLCSPNWEAIAARLRNLRIRTKLITNGVLLGRTMAGRLRDAGIGRVGVSIDGLEATHDYIRGRPGLFRHILAGVEALLEAGVPVTIITTVTDMNVGQLPALRGVLSSLGVDMWQFQPIFPLGRAQGCLEMALSTSAYLRLGAFARDWVRASGARPAALPGDSFGYFTSLDQRQPPWGGCSAGLVLCGITSDGRVKGCLSMPDELTEGDLRRQDLWSIWFDASAFGYNRHFTTDTLGPNCRTCEHASVCRGGCTSMSYGCTARLHNDPYCFNRLLAGGHRM
jgi:radical SAM protein with 4Fe4S-binding SPASM domain